MRVGYVLKRFPRLSQTFVLHELLELERRGVDVVVLAGRDGGEELTHPAVARLRAPVTYVGPDAGPAAQAVAAAVAEHGLTHLHAHFAGWAARVADAAGTAAGVPFSLTAHATDIYRADVDTTALADLLTRAAAVVTVTDGNVGVLGAMAPGARVVRVYNGVDVTGIAPGPRAADRTRTVLAVGRFVPKKGFDDLLRALAVLRAQGTDVAVRFVGDGPERGPLTTLAADLGVADLVSMPGSADGEAVAAAMRSAAVLAVPCVVTADGDRDALPTVVIEAMAHGLPVLATDVNGLPEMVEDTVSGVVVPQRSPEVLAAALARLLDDPAGRDALATAARSRAEALFDLRRNVGALADLYAGAGGRPVTGPYGTALLTDTSVVLPDPPVATDAMLADARRVLSGRWLLVGEEYDLGPDPDWERNPSSDKEWQIAQHKHYFGRNLLHGLLATGDPAYLDVWARLLRTWLTRMGTGFVVVSDAQVEALRLRSWVESLLLLRQAHARGLLDAGAAADAVDDDLLRTWVQRMGDEAHYVSTHLKPVRNHRTFQLHSVFLTGVCVPQAPGAKALVAEAVRLLEDNLLREILPDGVHVEMATHYHQLVAETALDVATLAARNRIALDPALLHRIHAMTQWSAWLTWPDGHIPLLGDSDDGDHAALLLGAGALFDDPGLTWVGSRGARGRRPGVPSRDFPDAGYTVLTDTADASDPAVGGSGYERRTHVLVDSALLGEGAHAHYDALSVVLHCDGAPALVDPGRYTYSGDLDADGVDWRHTFKTTRAHNTVTVDGRDQTRYLSRNKHGPDHEIRSRAVHVGRDGDWVAADVVSDEYTPVHTRVVVFVRRQYLLVVDRVAPLPGDTGEHTAEVAWHLPAGGTASVADLPSGSAARRTVVTAGTPAAMLLDVPAGADVRVDDGWVSTLYGVKHPAHAVRATAAGTGDLLLVSAVAPRTTGVEVLGLAAAAGPVPAWDVLVRNGGEEVVDRIWLPPAPGAVTADDGTAVEVAGRFLLVRADASGRPLWATGEGVTGAVSGVGLGGLLDPVAADGAVEDGGQPV